MNAMKTKPSHPGKCFLALFLTVLVCFITRGQSNSDHSTIRTGIKFGLNNSFNQFQTIEKNYLNAFHFGIVIPRRVAKHVALEDEILYSEHEYLDEGEYLKRSLLLYSFNVKFYTNDRLNINVGVYSGFGFEDFVGYESDYGLIKVGCFLVNAIANIKAGIHAGMEYESDFGLFTGFRLNFVNLNCYQTRQQILQFYIGYGW
jgi:hypothetical protein